MRSVRSRVSSRIVITTILLLITGVRRLAAQTSSVTSGTTPTALAIGGYTASSDLLPIERYAAFTGRMSFVVPLRQVGGRGTASYEMVLVPISYFEPTPTWAPLAARVRTGHVFGRESNLTLYRCGNGSTVPNYTLSRLTFTGPDGTEVEMVDTNTSGSPYIVPNECSTSSTSWDAGRSTTFASRDGSQMVFTARTRVA